MLRAPLAGLPTDTNSADVVFRLATSADLDRLEPFARGRGRAYRQHVEVDGNWLFVACDGERIVGTWLVSTDVPPDGLLSRVVRLDATQVWSRDIFCAPEYRGRRIAERLVRASSRHLTSLGYVEYLMSVSSTNLPSLRLSFRLHGHPILYVAHSTFLFSRRLRITREIPDFVLATRRQPPST